MRFLKLFEIAKEIDQSKNKYCGPAVMAFVTKGLLTASEGAQAIRRHDGQRSVKGAYTRDLLSALEDCGVDWKNDPLPHAIKMPAKDAIAELSDASANRIFLCVAADHFFIITDRHYACGQVHEPVPVFVGDDLNPRFAHIYGPRKPLISCHELFNNDVHRPPWLDTDISIKKSVTSMKARLRRLAKKHGITIETDDWRDSFYVYAKPEVEEHPDWEHSNDHYCPDWNDIEERIEEIMAFQTEHSLNSRLYPLDQQFVDLAIQSFDSVWGLIQSATNEEIRGSLSLAKRRENTEPMARAWNTFTHALKAMSPDEVEVFRKSHLKGRHGELSKGRVNIWRHIPDYAKAEANWKYNERGKNVEPEKPGIQFSLKKGKNV